MKPPPFLLLLLWMIASPKLGNAQQPPPNELESISISQLESRLEEIDSKLENLSTLSLRGGTGAIGYRSKWGAPSQWIEIKLARTFPLDQIVLVPCLWRHPQDGFLTDAFPKQLRILAGSDRNEAGEEIAAYRQDLGTPKSIAPLVIPLDEIQASWIRIEATELSERNFDGNKVLQLSEVFIFSGSENVALHRPIKFSSSDQRGLSGAWNERFLVDGFTPYLMDSSQGARSNAFIGLAEDEPSFTIALNEAKLVSRIRLHAVEQTDTVPQAYADGLGIPSRMRIEGALQADFSDAVELLDYRRGGMLQIGPIITKPFPETLSRFIRLTPQIKPQNPQQTPRPVHIGFSEIEILSNGENIALNSRATSRGLKSGQRSPSALTDGNNLYGEILPLRDWMNELAKRGSLERHRPAIQAELNLRYDQQEKLLNRMIQLVIILILVIGFVILIDRHFRMRKVNQVRERIAADLHDELGANIHTIGLISDMAKHSINSPDELLEHLDEIRNYTERSGEAARYCTNILEARGVCEDLVEDMKTFADRILADIKHESSFSGKETLRNLNPHKRIDLFLFYKECLTNIIRHSAATKVTTKLEAEETRIRMNISDNGKGLKSALNGKIPPSLQRRAKLLGAKVSVSDAPTGGAEVSLILKNRKFRFPL